MGNSLKSATFLIESRLRDAARFEVGERDDVTLAERHLALALRLAPNDAELLAEYRRVAELLDQRQRQS